MDFLLQIGLLFTNMTWPVIVCLIIGIVLILVEIFQPGFGAFGASGLVLLILAIVLRGVFRQDEDDVLAQTFIMLFFLSIIIIVAFIIMVKSSKMGWLSRTPFIENATAVSPELSEGIRDYSLFMDKIGIAETALRPTGKIKIDNIIEDAYAEGFFIKKGEHIKVVDIKGGKITVRRID